VPSLSTTGDNYAYPIHASRSSAPVTSSP
jgi:hypothetical protein